MIQHEPLNQLSRIRKSFEEVWVTPVLNTHLPVTPDRAKTLGVQLAMRTDLAGFRYELDEIGRSEINAPRYRLRLSKPVTESLVFDVSVTGSDPVQLAIDLVDLGRQDLDRIERVLRSRRFVSRHGEMVAAQCNACAYLGRHGQCAAFPSGIPAAILLNEADHRTPYPGDNGIQFELKPGARSPYVGEVTNG